MELIRFSFFLSISLTVALAAEKEMVPFWEEQESGVTSGMRGVSAVSEDVAWASGTFGTVIKTVDGGATWEKVR